MCLWLNFVKVGVAEVIISSKSYCWHLNVSVEKADWNPCYWLVIPGTATPSVHAGPTMSQKNIGATGPDVVVLPTIEDIYLPPRYQRRPIDEKEIAYINVSILLFYQWLYVIKLTIHIEHKLLEFRWIYDIYDLYIHAILSEIHMQWKRNKFLLN